MVLLRRHEHDQNKSEMKNLNGWDDNLNRPIQPINIPNEMMTKIEEVYTIPKTEEEWKLLDEAHGFNVVGEENGFVKGQDCVVYESEGLYQALLRLEDNDLIEIPVERFLELINDRIVGWRLEELGFEKVEKNLTFYVLKIANTELSWSEKTKNAGVGIEIGEEAVWLNISTFTELLQQMKFLGWKNETNQTSKHADLHL